MKVVFNKIDAELQLMKWMLGASLALSGTVVGLLLNIVFKGVKLAGGLNIFQLLFHRFHAQHRCH
jgi:hypothetical protein